MQEWDVQLEGTHETAENIAEAVLEAAAPFNGVVTHNETVVTVSLTVGAPDAREALLSAFRVLDPLILRVAWSLIHVQPALTNVTTGL